MTTIINAEYLIASALCTKDIVSFAELNDFSYRLQNYLNKAGIDAVSVCHSLPTVVYNYSNYFTLVGNNHIVRTHGVTADDLKARFVGYLPRNVLTAIMQTGA